MPIKNEFDTLNYLRQIRNAAGSLVTQSDDIQIKETDVNDSDWTDVEVRATKDAQAYVNKYRAFTDMNHNIAYEDLSNVASVSLIEEDGSRRNYAPQRIVTDTEGVTGWILKPLNTPAGEIPKVKVAFRGTVPSCTASLACDAERGGAGAVSFARNRDNIVKQINGALAEYNGKVTLDIGGHSLGSALASYCTAAVRESIAENLGLTSTHPIPANDRNHLAKISHLRVSGNNGAGINHAIATRNAGVVGYLAEQRIKGRTDLTLSNYKLKRRADGIQLTGETELDADVPYHHVEVDVMKVDGTKTRTLSLPAATAVVAAGVVVGAATGGIAAPTMIAIGGVVTNGAYGAVNTLNHHTQNIFDPSNPAAVYAYERLSNKEQPAAVSKELNNKSSWLNRIQSGVFAVKDGVASVVSGAACLFSNPFSRAPKQAAGAPGPAVKVEPEVAPLARRTVRV